MDERMKRIDFIYLFWLRKIFNTECTGFNTERTEVSNIIQHIKNST